MNCLLFKYCLRYDLDWDQPEWTEYPYNSCVLIEILIQGVVCCEKFLLLSGRCIENVETKQET